MDWGGKNGITAYSTGESKKKHFINSKGLSLSLSLFLFFSSVAWVYKLTWHRNSFLDALKQPYCNNFVLVFFQKFFVSGQIILYYTDCNWVVVFDEERERHEREEQRRLPSKLLDPSLQRASLNSLTRISRAKSLQTYTARIVYAIKSGRITSWMTIIPTVIGRVRVRIQMIRLWIFIQILLVTVGPPRYV